MIHGWADFLRSFACLSFDIVKSRNGQTVGASAQCSMLHAPMQMPSTRSDRSLFHFICSQWPARDANEWNQVETKSLADKWSQWAKTKDANKSTMLQSPLLWARLIWLKNAPVSLCASRSSRLSSYSELMMTKGCVVIKLHVSQVDKRARAVKWSRRG